ncbi:hypothetical protein BpHYR1_054310 [Brachionus plicatilis]|uniref:Uncharacterized protein n=1 Tax=Brachionus plicatilis TaxID=10195 RepID=A0A3M7T4U3_BRAPC|nr:hypothetical protein BpHYR1_054310 [Brachionus plicatilis]
MLSFAFYQTYTKTKRTSQRKFRSWVLVIVLVFDEVQAFLESEKYGTSISQIKPKKRYEYRSSDSTGHKRVHNEH